MSSFSALDSPTDSSPQTPGKYISSSGITILRQRMAADVWLFMQWVCQPYRAATGGFYVERFHRPIAYMLQGDAYRLAASLEAYQSEPVRQIRSELQSRNINWQTAAGIRRLKRLLQRVNNRISRSMAKTTEGLDILCFEGTHNPDLDIGIASKSDPAAWAMCVTIGAVMRSDAYAQYYPDRLFTLDSGKGYNYDSYITQEWITFRGASRGSKHKTIVARGINSQWYSWHGNVIYCDDLASTEAKQGVATVEDALRFIASMSGLSKADQWGGTREVFNGTITGPADDNSVLKKNPEYLSTCIPIWIKSVPSSARNIMIDGVPVLPEWYSVEDIQRKRQKELTNTRFGIISWLQNFELSAHEAGSMSFTQEMLDRAKFTWVLKTAITPTGKNVQERWIRRYLWEDKEEVLPDGTVIVNKLPKRSPSTPPLPAGRSCGCWMHCAYPDHAYLDFLPAHLPRVLGVDQAYAASGDKWSVANISRDPHDYFYALRGKSGHGYTAMIAAIPIVCNMYGGENNFPHKVGIESNAVQSNTAYWMQQNEEVFGLLARRIAPVSPGNIQKTLRIFGNVYAAMESGKLLIDPDDADFQDEALAYDPNAKDPDDGILDSISIGAVLHSVNASDPTEDKARIAAEERMWQDDVDPVTGVDVSTDFTDYTDDYGDFGDDFGRNDFGGYLGGNGTR